jgi:hypothetical protein
MSTAALHECDGAFWKAAHSKDVEMRGGAIKIA